MFVAYTNSDIIGSPGAMYDQLTAAALKNPVEGNAQGSYLTMRSVNGLIFGVINIVGYEFLRSPEVGNELTQKIVRRNFATVRSNQLSSLSGEC